jgi:hypothetical protein
VKHYSPGVWHTRVPRTRAANVRFRLYVIRRCRKEPQFRRAVLEMCRQDILFWIGKGSEKVGPFVTWEFQDEAVRTILDCIAGRKDLVIEKSREMGASWLCLLVMTWFLIFQPMESFLCISRNAEAVDDPAKSSLFAKIDYVLDHLPEWMAEKGPGRINRRVMSFVNDANGSEITGQASTRKAGVGGRATAIFVDEFSQIDADWQVLERTANTSGCRIFNGTHLGTNTAFFDLCTRATNGEHVRKLVLHWTQHPDKNRGLYHFDRLSQQIVYHDARFKYPRGFRPVADGTPTGGPAAGVRSPWYDMMCEKIGNTRGVAADLDINPSGSTEQVFDPLLVADLKARYCTDPVLADLEYDKEAAIPRRLHISSAGKLRLWCRLDSVGKPPPSDYVAGADVATGTGATPTTLSVANARTGEKVAEYADSRVEPKEFAYYAVAVCRLFANAEGRGAKFGWETPGPGNTVTKHVLALMYQPIYFRKTEHRMKKELSDTPGWPNSPDSVRNLIENYRDALRGGHFLNRSADALSECLAFVYEPDGYVYHNGWRDPKDPSAARINHGDRVIADAIAWKLCDEWGKLAAAATDDPTAGEAVHPHQFDPRGLAGRRAFATLQSREDW